MPKPSMSQSLQPPGSSPLPAYLMSKDRGYLRLLLWIGALVGISIGWALNSFFPEIYVPLPWYLALGGSTILIAILSRFFPVVARYLPDLTFLLLVVLYISVVWLTYLNHLDPVFISVLIASHILLGISFRHVGEYIVFGGASLLLFVICTLVQPVLKPQHYLFMGLMAIMTGVVVLYIWSRAKTRKAAYDQQMLTTLLDNALFGIFLLDLHTDTIFYQNKRADEVLDHFLGETDIPGESLLDLLGLDPAYLHNRFIRQTRNQPEKSYHQRHDKAHKARDLELHVSGVMVRGIRALLLKVRDISPIREQERRLARSRQVNDSLLQAIPDMLVMLNQDLRIDYAHTQATSLQVLLKEADTGLNYRQLAESWMTAAQQLEFEKCLQVVRGGSESAEMQFVCQRDGADLFLEQRLVPIGDGRELLVMIRDVSAQHRAQLAVRESEQNYREIFHGATEGIIIVEPGSFTWLDGNRRAQTLLVVQAADAGGREIVKWAIPEHRDRIIHLLNSAVEGQVAEAEVRFRPDRGPAFFGGLSARFVVLGGAFRILIHLRDITLRKATDGALAQSKTRYQTLVEKMNEGLVLTDKDEKILFVNQSLCRILGKSESVLLGQKTNDIFGEGRYDTLIAEKRKLREQGISDEYEIELTRPNGTAQWLLIGGAPYINEQGDAEGAIAIVSDITEQKKTLFKLAEKNEELDAFVYKASHDLKGPLASIIGVTNIARDEVSDKGALGYFDLISKSTKRLDMILSELIELTRINKSEISAEPIALEAFVEDIIQGLQHQAKAQGIDFQLDVDADFKLESDRKLLQSILGNLIANAINYHNHDQELPFVRVSARQVHQETVISVEDNGVGIPERMQQRVFEMFYRGTNRSKGSGLGLYIVKTSVEKLEGRIRLSSVPGQGSTFSIYLPLLKVSVPNTAPESSLID